LFVPFQRSLPLSGTPVEDEQVNREFGAEPLKESRLRVETADDGEMAVELAGRNDYAAILMDVKMPIMDGIEATRRILALARGSSVPIVAMTAFAFPDDRQRCLDAGIDDYIARPIDPATLATVLLKWMRPPDSR
jgi:two-component system, sensor histidine kinase and response regulator